MPCIASKKCSIYLWERLEVVLALSIVSFFHFVRRFSGNQVCSRAFHATNERLKSIVGNIFSAKKAGKCKLFTLAMLSTILGEKY